MTHSVSHSPSRTISNRAWFCDTVSSLKRDAFRYQAHQGCAGPGPRLHPLHPEKPVTSQSRADPL